MFLTRQLKYARRFYTELDYASHMPKAYVDRAKGHSPRKVYDNRFGAPPVVRWRTPPDDYKQVTKEIYNEEGKLPAAFRPWESDRSRQSVDRMYDYHRALLQSKFFRKGHKSVPPIPEENWTIFQGDMVEVLVGKDKGKQGHVSRIIREENAVFVEGLHQKLIETIGRDQAEKYDVDAIITPVEQPLFVHEGQVMLVDPNDGEACTAKWILNDSKTDYTRVSTRTGYEIPIPTSAYRNYEYVTPDSYMETDKDTPADVVLQQTYKPKLCTFEQEIEEEMGLEKRPLRREGKPPTYWY